MTDKILVIDDSPTQLARLSFSLKTSGYEVITARNGLEAMEVIYQERPALVISDILMPVINGYQLCRLLKNDPGTRNIPVILLTSLDSKHDRFWGMKAGADRYVSKESNPDRVLDAVQELFTGQPGSETPSKTINVSASSSLNIQSRLSSLLDQLLFESTLANETARLNAVATEGAKLAQQLFVLLSEVIEYETVALVRVGANHHFEVQSRPLDTEPELELVKDWIEGMIGGKLQIDPFEAASESELFLAYPVSIEQEVLGAVVVTISGHTGGESRESYLNILRIVTNSLGSILKTLKLHEQVTANALENERLYKELKEVEGKRDDLLHMITHDLRIPLTTITGSLELLSDEQLMEADPAIRTELLTAASDASSNLNRMISDMLDISKLESGDLKPALKPFKIPALVGQVLESFTYAARNRNNRLITTINPELPPALGDAELVQRVMGNLVLNALKYAPGTEITVNARTVALADYGLKTGNDTGQGVLVEVVDRGPGIAPEHLSHLFDKFYQVSREKRAQRAGNTGLGLTFCKRAIEAQNGMIGVQSELKKGSTFYFVLPAAPAS